MHLHLLYSFSDATEIKKIDDVKLPIPFTIPKIRHRKYTINCTVNHQITL